MAARGELPDDEETTPEPEPSAQGGGLLRRFFPPAPPLPGRPDPLAGFDRSGPVAPVRERIFLLRRNLLAWVLTGVVAFLGFFASFFYAATPFGLIGTFVLFGSLIGAGWFGWQRPTLYGTAAALLSYFVLTAIVLWMFSSLGAPPETFGTPAEVIGQLALQAAYQAGLGFLGGWYGGYLRRRQTQLSTEVRRRR
jgi:hypothetical protein